MYKHLSLGSILKTPKKNTLKWYLDAGYEFNHSKTQEQHIKKDISFKYSYRFICSTYNENMYGVWSGSSWIVTKTPVRKVNISSILWI